MSSASDVLSHRMPWRLRPLGTRSPGVAAPLAGLAALLLGLAIAWPSPPPTPAPGQAQGARQAQARAQTVETWTQLRAATAPCDAAVAAVAENAPPPSDPRAPSGPAAQARDRCRSAGLALLGLHAPRSLDAIGRAGFETAIQQCQYLYLVEGNAHGRLARALEEANTAVAPDPRALFEAWADVHEANIDAQGCWIGFITAGRRAGLPLALFDLNPPRRSPARGVVSV